MILCSIILCCCMRVYIIVALTHVLFPFYILIYIDCIFNLCICQVKCGFHPIRKRVGFRHKFITNQYTKHHDGNIRKILFRSLCKIHKLPALPIVLTLSSLLPLLILSYKCHLLPIPFSASLLSDYSFKFPRKAFFKLFFLSPGLNCFCGFVSMDSFHNLCIHRLIQHLCNPPLQRFTACIKPSLSSLFL